MFRLLACLIAILQVVRGYHTSYQWHNRYTQNNQEQEIPNNNLSPTNRYPRQLSFNQPPLNLQPRPSGNRFDQDNRQFNNNNNWNWNSNRRFDRFRNRPIRQDLIFFSNDDEDNGFNIGNNIGNGNGFGPTPRPQRQTTTTVRIPGMGTTRSPCEDACQTTLQYNPVCGTDQVTYANIGRLRCAQRCGKDVSIARPIACTRVQ